MEQEKQCIIVSELANACGPVEKDKWKIVLPVPMLDDCFVQVVLAREYQQWRMSDLGAIVNHLDDIGMPKESYVKQLKEIACDVGATVSNTFYIEMKGRDPLVLFGRFCEIITLVKYRLEAPYYNLRLRNFDKQACC